jgi:hypothetical protein
MPYSTNVPKDVSTNTLHFWNDVPINAVGALDLANDVADFYRIPHTTGGIGIGNAMMSGHMSRTANACRTTVWNLSDPLPRVALAELTWTMPAVNTGVVATILNHPAEVSIVMSIFNQPVSGVPAGRQRNRIYIGPLMAYGQAGGGTTFLPTVGGQQSTMILDAAQALWDATSAGGIAQWIVYSATAEAGTGDFEWPVYRIRVNNEYDTQRRRQPSVTSAVDLIV